MPDLIAEMDVGGSGLFPSSSGADVTALVSIEDELSWSRGNQQLREFSPPEAGEADFVLHDPEGNFSPGNMTSPYYGLVDPGKIEIRLRTGTGSGGPVPLEPGGGDLLLETGDALLSEDAPGRPIWRGVLTGLPPMPEFSRKAVGVRGLGSLSRLVGRKVNTRLYRDITTDVALGYLLDAAGWPSTRRNFQTGNVTLRWWWYKGDDVMSEADRLKNTEGVGAALYEDAAGSIVFQNSTARQTQARSTIPQATWSDIGPNANLIAPIEYDQNYKDLVIQAVIAQADREIKELAEIWSYGGDLTLTANQVKTLEVSASDPFLNAVAPSQNGTNEEQVLTASAALTNGTYKAKVNGTWTSSINYNDSTATTQAAFEAAAGPGNVICAGALATGLRVQFTGDLKEKEVEPIEIESHLNVGSKHATIRVIDATDGSNSKYIIYPSAPPLAGGHFRIHAHGADTPSTIPFNADAALILLRLNAIGILTGNVSVTGSNDISTDQQTIEFINALAGAFVSLSITDDSTLMTNTDATATVNVVRTVKGGGPDFVTLSGDVSFALDFDNGASVMLTVTAGATGWTGSGLRVRAQTVSIVRTNEVKYPLEATGLDSQVYKPEVRAEVDFNVVELNAMDAFNHYKNLRSTVVAAIMPMRNDNPALDSYLAREISDRIRLTIGHLMITKDYFIEHVAGAIFMNQWALVFGLEEAV
jgi:hypothetical protein